MMTLTTRVADAAAIWAAAAGAAGAYAPAHVAAALTLDPASGLEAAARSGLAAAYAQAATEAGEGDFIVPRGLSVEYAPTDGGMSARCLVWRTSVTVEIGSPIQDGRPAHGDDPEVWWAPVHAPSEEEHGTRWQAAVAESRRRGIPDDRWS